MVSKTDDNWSSQTCNGYRTTGYQLVINKKTAAKQQILWNSFWWFVGKLGMKGNGWSLFWWFGSSLGMKENERK